MNQIDCIGISAAEEPVQVKVFEMETTEEIGPPENLGPQVNSFVDDMLPIVSPDGKTLYFARKRHPENVEMRNVTTSGIPNCRPTAAWALPFAWKTT